MKKRATRPRWLAPSSERVARILALCVAIPAAGALLAAILLGSARPASGSSPSVNVLNAQRVTQSFGWALTPDSLEATSDGGNAWAGIMPPGVDSSAVLSVDFVDPQHGWVFVLGQSAIEAYRTADGGATWAQSAVSQIPPGVSFLAGQTQAWTYFLSPDSGWVEVQEPSNSNFSFALLFGTTDGGVTWSHLAAPAAGSFAFSTPLDGWLAGGATGTDLYSTADGGRTWSSAESALPPDVSATRPFVAVAGNQGQLALRADAQGSGVVDLLVPSGGDSWSVDHSTGDSADLRGGDSPAMSLSESGLVVVSVDQGRSFLSRSGPGTAHSVWDSNLPTGGDSTVAEVSFPTQSSGWAVLSGSQCPAMDKDTAKTQDVRWTCSPFSSLYATADGGATWNSLSP